ncbi:MAG: hypothetical protein IT258_23495, partial [Saprospiraceae bacterium]|nr:hypothetical protein [Saprospiraceae bacterium]
AVCNLIYFQTAPGGDAVVGYAWSIIISVALFSLCLLVASALIGWKGGFGWVGTSTGERTVLVLLGLLLIIVGNGFFMMGEFPGDLHPSVRSIVRGIPAVLPVLLLVSAFILLNANYATLASLAYKLPVYSSLALSALGFLLILVGRAQNAAHVVKSEIAFQDKVHQDHLNQIDTTDVMKDMVFILVFTDANHDQDVREKALAKIKSRPDWQEELVRRLQNDWAPQAFTFLASNEVDDKSLFPEAVRQGVVIQAKLIRESIRRCRGDFDLYDGSFLWEVERALRTVDKFQGMGVDYRPAVQEMRNALEEPTDFEKPKLPVMGVLDKWLKQH